jgi:hypothetical protein
VAQAKERKRTQKQFAAMMDELLQVCVCTKLAVHGNALWTPRNVIRRAGGSEVSFDP